MRKFFGSTKPLRSEKKTLPDFKYLKEDEFLKVLSFLYIGQKNKASVETYKLLFKILFYSGVRTGEAFALNKNTFNGINTLKVHTQLERGDKPSDTKNGQLRSTFLLDAGVSAFNEWVNSKDKSNISRHGIAEIIKRACKKAFPYDETKWITAHDLCHSYAVLMLTKHDLSITQIAKLLGNSVLVCEDYYLRFQDSDDLIDSVGRKIHKAL